MAVCVPVKRREVVVPVARRVDNGKLVRRDEAAVSSFNCEWICVECKERIVWKACKKKMPHWAHKNTTNCSGGESIIHKWSKEFFAQNSTQYGFRRIFVFACGCVDEIVYSNLKGVVEDQMVANQMQEKYGRKQIPDVALYRSKRNQVMEKPFGIVEVHHTNPKTDFEIYKYKAMYNGFFIELKPDDILSLVPGRIFTIDEQEYPVFCATCLYVKSFFGEWKRHTFRIKKIRTLAHKARNPFWRRRGLSPASANHFSLEHSTEISTEADHKFHISSQNRVAAFGDGMGYLRDIYLRDDGVWVGLY